MLYCVVLNLLKCSNTADYRLFCSGKTTLLAKLQGNEDPKKGSGLEFGYIDVRDEEEGEEHTLLNHFVLDGDVAHANLLQFALTEENVQSTTVLVS